MTERLCFGYVGRGCMLKTLLPSLPIIFHPTLHLDPGSENGTEVEPGGLRLRKKTEQVCYGYGRRNLTQYRRIKKKKIK